MDSTNAPQGRRLGTKTSGQKGAGADVVLICAGRRNSSESSRLRRKVLPQGSNSTRSRGSRRDRWSGLDGIAAGMFSSPRNELIDHAGKTTELAFIISEGPSRFCRNVLLSRT